MGSAVQRWSIASLSDPFANFQSLESNRAALALARLFGDAENRFGIIEGAHGWGKTHLLSAASKLKKGQAVRAAAVSALEFSSPSTPMLDAQLLFVDDLHLSESRPRVRQRLAFELERRRRAGKPTLCASAIGVPASLNLRRGWRREIVAAPTDDERAQVLLKLCDLESLKLEPKMAKLIACWVAGDGGTLCGVAKKLKVSGVNLARCHPLKVVGVLFPQFGPQTDDLRDIILNAAATAAMRDHKKTRTYSLQHLAVYLMRVEAELPEEKVADYFGVLPGEVFQTQRRAVCMIKDPGADLRNAVARALDVLNERICPI